MTDPPARSGVGADADAVRRAARRAFVRVHHPDRGGDAEEFVRGLAGFDPPGTARPTPSGTRATVTVYRTTGPVRTVRRALRVLHRRLRGRPARILQ